MFTLAKHTQLTKNWPLHPKFPPIHLINCNVEAGITLVKAILQFKKYLTVYQWLNADSGSRELFIEYAVFATHGTDLNWTEKNPITKVLQVTTDRSMPWGETFPTSTM